MCSNQGKKIIEEIGDSIVEEMVTSIMAQMEDAAALELSADPEANAIVDAYVSCERMAPSLQQLLGTLAKHYPSMRSLVQGLRDPAQNCLRDWAMQKIELKKQRRSFDRAKLMFSATKESACLMGVEVPNEMIKVERDVASLEPLMEKAESIVSSVFEYYLKIAQEVRNEAIARGVDPVAAMESQDFRDTVFRRVYPAREEGEGMSAFLRESAVQLMFTVRDFSRVMIDSIQDGDERAKIEVKMKQLPTPKAMSVYFEALREYSVREFDRIYGTVPTA